MRENKLLMLAYLLAIMLVLAAQDVRAQDNRWVQVGTSDNQSTYVYVDTQTIYRTGSKVQVWEKFVFTIPQYISTSPKYYMSSKARVNYDCRERKLLVAQTLLYADSDCGGDIISSVSNPDRNDLYQGVAPETIGEKILNFVCKETASPKK